MTSSSSNSVVETSGADVEDAIARALRQLDLSRNQVDVDVVREGRKGFLGLGAEEAVVRVTAKPGARPATGTGGGRRRTRGGRGRGGGATEQAERPGRAERPPGRERRGRPDRRERAPRPRGESVQAPIAVPGAPDDLPRGPSEEAEDEVDFAGRTLRDLLTLLGLHGTELTARDPETPGDGAGLAAQVFDIYGEDEDASEELAVLIGRRGETLSSLQYLLNVIVSGRYGSDHVFSVDVEQYRRRREDSLLQMAHRVAEEVRASGDVVTLEPMSPAERRIIHLTLQDEPGVTTESVGEGNDRQVEIMPE